MVLEHFIAGKNAGAFNLTDDYPLQPLEDDCKLLGSLLDECLMVEMGTEMLKKLERIRALSDCAVRLTAHHDLDGAQILSQKMAQELFSLPLEEALPILRALGHYLNLTAIAEMHHSVRTTRMEGVQVQSIDEIYTHFIERGYSSDELFNAVCKQHVEIVLTAHPTQVNRRTLQHKLTRIAQLLAQKEQKDLTNDERQNNLADIMREITALWQTDELRRKKPTPLDEARGGLHIVEASLWAAVPEHLRRVSAALKRHTDRELPIDAVPLRFGSWMGGDRDGNPNVTAKVTHDVSCLARWMAADLYLKEIDALRFELSMNHASEEVWKMAREVASKNAHVEGAEDVGGAAFPIDARALTGFHQYLPADGDLLLGETPTAGDALDGGLTKGSSFTIPPDRLAEMLRRGASIDEDRDAISSPMGSVSSPIGSPRRIRSPSGSTAYLMDGGGTNTANNSTHGGNGYSSVAEKLANASSSSLYSLGGGAAAPSVGGAKNVRASPSGLPRVKTVTPMTAEARKQRGIQAARYHKTTVDNLLHPRAAGAQPYRVVLGDVRAKLVNTRRRMEDLLAGHVPDDDVEWFSTESQFLAPLLAIYWSLWECGGGIVAEGRLLDVIRRIHCFGLSLMKLDLRQESSRHTETLDEVTQYLGLGSYSEWNEEKRMEWLVQELQGRRPLIPSNMTMTPDSQEVLDTFKIAAHLGRQCLSAYVISMATRASDVLAVELLQREARMLALSEAGRNAGFKTQNLAPLDPPLRVVPLFETLADLEAAGGIMRRLLSDPYYRQHLATVHNSHQEVMLGYSDSGKDAGRLAAAWALYKCQEDLVAVCKEFDVQLTLFHGRGGTIGRGGGPMAVAIQSQPPGSVQGSLRLTEQGEMVQAKFGVPSCAVQQLELFGNAVLMATLDPPKAPKDGSWRELMEEMSEVSCKAYRQVVFEDPNFIQYFHHATPESELGNLNIGSRPSRRKAGADVTTLRAIPWIFAWTQNRMVLPTWLGVADAIQSAVKNGKSDVLRDMYEHWPFFSSVVDLIEMVLTKADPAIAALYDERLVSNPNEKALGEKLRKRLVETGEVILSMSGHAHLGDGNTTLKHLVRMRKPFIDPINVMQVEILRRLRLDPDNQRLRDALLLTVNGVSAGMRNTG